MRSFKSIVFVFSFLVSNPGFAARMSNNVLDSSKRPLSVGQCQEVFASTKRICEQKIKTDEVDKVCQFDTSVLEAKLTIAFDKYVSCGKELAAKRVKECVDQGKLVVGFCIAGSEDSRTAAAKATQRMLEIALQLDEATDIERSFLRGEIALHNSDAKETDSAITAAVAYKLAREKEQNELIAELEKRRPKPTEEAKPADVADSEKKPINPDVANNSKRESGYSPSAGLSKNNLSAPPKSPQAVVQSVLSGSELSNSARKIEVNAPQALKPILENISGTTLPEKKTEAPSQAGQLAQQKGMSGALAAGTSSKPSSSSTQRNQQSLQNPSTQSKDATVSTGFHSGASSQNRHVENFSRASMTAMQLQKRLTTFKGRTPSQIRFQSGITGPHSDIFKKVNLRYERMSSSLRP